MVTEELLRYVEYQANRGIDKSSIKMTLLQAGWTGDDIKEAFTVVDTVASSETAGSVVNTPAEPAELASQPVSNQPDPYTNPVQNTQPAQTNYAQPEPIQSAVNETASNATAPDLAKASVSNESNPVDAVTELKYRKAADWQQGKQAIANNIETINPGNVSAINNPGPTATVAAAAAGSVYRPQISNYQSGDLNNSSRVAVNPAQALRQQKMSAQNQTTKKSKAKGVILTLIGLVVLLAAGFYVFQTFFARPSYNVSEVVSAMKGQEYILYDASGGLPTVANAGDSELPDLIDNLNSQLAVSVQGLIEPQSGNNGFGLSVGETTFDYVLYNGSSYGKVRSLPADKASLYPDLIGNWFEISDGPTTQSLLRLISAQPATSLTNVGRDLASALGMLNEAGLLNVAYLSSDTDQSGAKIDTFSIAIDVATLTSRLSTESAMLLDLVDATGITEINGQARINRDTKLPTRLDLRLLTVSGSEEMSVTFNYDYNDVPVSTPPQVVPSADVIASLETLAAGGEVEDIKSKLQLLASDASVFFSTNDTYLDFCFDTQVTTLNTTITDRYNRQAVCQDTAATFVYQVPLSDPTFNVCVDTNFVPVITNQSLVAGAITCGPAAQYQPPVNNPTTPADTTTSADSTTTSNTISDEEFFE